MPSVLTQFTHAGEVMHREDIAARSGMWQHPWYFMNRSSLHRALRKKAEDVGVNVVMGAEFGVTGMEGLHGESVTVKYGSGTKIGDLVIAADDRNWVPAKRSGGAGCEAGDFGEECLPVSETTVSIFQS
jgi:2-polyprenyl-6-methoxyphenol hydroxylase-like FAD-dependent oxidoreductase